MYKEKIDAWLKVVIARNERDSTGAQLFTEMEIAHVQRLIDYLDVVKTPHANTSEQDKLWNDFKNFYLQYDVRRGKDFRATWPKEYVEWLDSIDVAVPTAEEINANAYRDEVNGIAELKGDPATIEAGYVSDEVTHGWNTKKDQLGRNE